MLRIVRERGLLEGTMGVLSQRIDLYVNARVKGLLTVGVLVFSDGYGPLVMTGPARDWLREGQGGKA